MAHYDIDKHMFSSSKVISLAAAIVQYSSRGEQKVGLCHGTFDAMHPGHIWHLMQARDLCDLLVVSVSSDEEIARTKGSDRPIFSETVRAYCLAALKCVDRVIISTEETALTIIDNLRPNLYIKGGEYKEKMTGPLEREAAAVRAYGGEVRFTPAIATQAGKLSTSGIVGILSR